MLQVITLKGREPVHSLYIYLKKKKNTRNIAYIIKGKVIAKYSCIRVDGFVEYNDTNHDILHVISLGLYSPLQWLSIQIYNEEQTATPRLRTCLF